MKKRTITGLFIIIFITTIGCFNNELWNNIETPVAPESIAIDFFEIDGSDIKLNFPEAMDTSYGLVRIRDANNNSEKIFFNLESSGSFTDYIWSGDTLEIDISSLNSPGSYKIEIKNFITLTGDTVPLVHHPFTY